MLWQSTRASNGHGRVWWQGQYCSVSRLAYEEWLAPIPSGMAVAHHCNRIRCIEPRHLLCVPRSSIDERIHRLLGENHQNHKLTAKQVREIRASHKSNRILAAHFGVCPKTVSLIKQRKTWAHIK